MLRKGTWTCAHKKSWGDCDLWRCSILRGLRTCCIDMNRKLLVDCHYLPPTSNKGPESTACAAKLSWPSLEWRTSCPSVRLTACSLFQCLHWSPLARLHFFYPDGRRSRSLTRGLGRAPSGVLQARRGRSVHNAAARALLRKCSISNHCTTKLNLQIVCRVQYFVSFYSLWFRE